MHTHTNKLIHETSPYLLQHAHNPVDWYPWGEEALNRAKEEDKPILVSIGYAACHWCHVMERESFEDEATAKIMNEYFINIKIDREERPDLDHIYMDAVQAMSGSGGWPLNVFLTPDRRPFYGGTYFPPVNAYNRASWTEVLQNVHSSFTSRRHEVDAQAENLTAHLEKANSFGKAVDGNTEWLFSAARPGEIMEQVMKAADKEWGGFGRAPKFPQTFTIQFLLRYELLINGIRTAEEQAGDANAIALQQALLSLDRMIEGGIYDQAGGGFSRYSTDTEWLAPHFEKMLYDNALLVSVISEAYQFTKKERYKEVIKETMEFIQRELMSPEGGFYAALDADSEGVEGKFYVWERKEVLALLGEDGPVFCQYYDISDRGNWEEKNILRVKIPMESFAAQHNIALAELRELLERGRQKLMEKRKERVRPALDDKSILGWNALMNTACSKAFAATGIASYRELAVRNMKFMEQQLGTGEEGEWYHTWKGGEAKYPAFLDDYAYLIQAMIHLQEVTLDTAWLKKAKKLAGFVQENFKEEETGLFFYTKKGQADVILRKKEIYDGAVPSGNAIMAENLYHLGILFDERRWKEQAVGMVSSLGQAIVKYPTSFGCWNNLLLELIGGTLEIAIVGKDLENIHQEILKILIPNRVLMGMEKGESEFPLLVGKQVNELAEIYLCRDYSCRQPVNSVAAFRALIDRRSARN